MAAAPFIYCPRCARMQEDLTTKDVDDIIGALRRGETPKAGPRCALTGLSLLGEVLVWQTSMLMSLNCGCTHLSNLHSLLIPPGSPFVPALSPSQEWSHGVRTSWRSHYASVPASRPRQVLTYRWRAVAIHSGCSPSLRAHVANKAAPHCILHYVSISDGDHIRLRRTCGTVDDNERVRAW